MICQTRGSSCHCCRDVIQAVQVALAVAVLRRKPPHMSARQHAIDLQTSLLSKVQLPVTFADD